MRWRSRSRRTSRVRQPPDLAALRMVVRNGTGREMADLLPDDTALLLPRLQQQVEPVRGPQPRGFDHATAQHTS
jgi:hypothetical protein